jgi:hypothetical protein
METKYQERIEKLIEEEFGPPEHFIQVDYMQIVTFAYRIIDEFSLNQKDNINDFVDKFNSIKVTK